MVLGWYRRSPRLWENASKKSHFRKLFFEFRSHFRTFFEISKNKNFGTITFFYGKNFRSLAQSLKKLEQKQIFENFFFNQVSLYVWASYSGIRPNFKVPWKILYVPRSKLLVCKVWRNSKKKFRTLFEHPKKFQLTLLKFWFIKEMQFPIRVPIESITAGVNIHKISIII
jgi:hypothetical protein